MHKEEEEKECCFNYLFCPSFSIYSSDKVPNIVDQLISDHHDYDTFAFPEQELDSVMLQPHMSKFKLFISNDNYLSDSISSSKVDELDAIPKDTYCLWTPKLPQSVRLSPNSSSSKIWKLLDFLLRIKKGGKITINFLKKKGEAKSETSKRSRGCGSSNKITGKKLSGKGERKLTVRVSGNEERRIIENKRRTYLPYKQGLFGFSLF